MTTAIGCAVKTSRLLTRATVLSAAAPRQHPGNIDIVRGVQIVQNGHEMNNLVRLGRS